MDYLHLVLNSTSSNPYPYLAPTLAPTLLFPPPECFEKEKGFGSVGACAELGTRKELGLRLRNTPSQLKAYDASYPTYYP